MLFEDIIHKSFSGSDRSIKAKKNILGMLILKGGNILIGLLLVPLTLNFVDKECYGIWLTLSSMVAWISFFDIGLSNGLRNRLTEAMAMGDKVLCKKYVSTTYAILALIFIPLMVLLLVVLPLVDWAEFLNVNNKHADGLLTAFAIIVVYFCLNFILSTINTVILAEQRPADASLQQFCQQLLSLIVIYLLTIFTEGNLINLCLGLCFAPLVIVAVFNLTLFAGRYKYMRPSISSVDFKCAPNLLKLGVQFFIIQIAAIIQYQAINFIILKYYGAGDVTSYNIAYKYFGVLYMVWGILTTPLWSATTDALARKDYQWVRNAQMKYLKYLLLFVVGGCGMLAISGWIYNLWVGADIAIGFSLSLWVLLYNIVMMFGAIFVMVINGSGELKIQTIASMISPVLFIGLCALFIHLDWGIHSILIAAIIANFNGLILAPMQCYGMLRKVRE